MSREDELRRELIPGRFVLVVNDDGEWRIYLLRSGARSSHLTEVDLSYKGPGTTEWRLHFGREYETNQCVKTSMIVGVYDTAEDALRLTPILESGRRSLQEARDQFRVLMALIGNISPR